MLLRDLKLLVPQLNETRNRLRQADKVSEKAAEKSAVKTVTDAAALPSAAVAPDEIITRTQLEQVRSLLGDVLSEVVTDNNSTLTDQISKTVTSDILREMDDLFQAKERREEEHFRKLDSLIRQQQANRRESAKGNAVVRLKKIFT